VAVAINDTHLTCTPDLHVGSATFPLALVTLLRAPPSATSSMTSSTLIPLTKVGADNYFEFLSWFTGIDPTSAMAQTGLRLTINGRGFQVRDSLTYECVVALWTGSTMQRAAEAAAYASGMGVRDLKISSDQLHGTQYVVANVTWLSSTQLLTSSIVWPFEAAKTLVFVRNRIGRDSGAAQGEGPGGGTREVLAVFGFSFGEGVKKTEAKTSGLAMDDVFLTFHGAGFDVLSEYTCALIFWQTLSSISTPTTSAATLLLSSYAQIFINETTGVMGGLRWGWNASVVTVARNTSVVVCPAIQWPFGAGNVASTLLRNGSVVVGSVCDCTCACGGTGRELLAIREHWTHVTPHSIASNGATIMIHGFGFSDTVAADTQYKCTLTQNSSLGILLSYTTPAIFSTGTNSQISNVMSGGEYSEFSKDSTRLVCTLPSGVGDFVAGLRVHVAVQHVHDNSSISTLSSKSLTQYRSLSISETLLTVTPSIASARGGTLVYLFGHAFDGQFRFVVCLTPSLYHLLLHMQA